MKIPKIADAVGQIDDDLIHAAAQERRAVKRPWIKWTAIAAASLAVLVSGLLVLPGMLSGDLPEGNPIFGKVVSFGDLDRHYKYTSVSGSESAIVWPYEYLTVQEKHASIIWMFKSYHTTNVTVGTEHLGDKIGNYLGFEIRSIKDIPEEYAIALGLEGDWYVYRYHDGLSDKPATLGELFDRYSLSETLELSRFTDVKGRDEAYYSLNDDDYIIEVLASCRDAKLYADCDSWHRGDEYLSFTLTSDQLGVYKKAMYITKDGYLWTNAFDYAYVYEIGEEAAGKIIDYAMANSTEKRTYEPYEYTLAGTVVEIKDGYVYIDDSIMCINKNEGMVFRASMADIRVRRCIEYAGVGVGDVVVVTFRGGIAVEDGNLITGVIGIEHGHLGDYGVSVPE